jgi:hypothetical protein
VHFVGFHMNDWFAWMHGVEQKVLCVFLGGFSYRLCLLKCKPSWIMTLSMIKCNPPNALSESAIHIQFVAFSALLCSRRIIKDLTSSSNDQIWTRLQPLIEGQVSGADSTRFSFLQTADVMTWYRLGETESGERTRSTSFGSSNHRHDQTRSNSSHGDLKALQRPNLSIEQDFKDTRRISATVTRLWIKEVKSKICPGERKCTEKSFLKLNERLFYLEIEVFFFFVKLLRLGW